jgi:dTDP-4-dehydrorhamnose 3,5-epimerase
MNVIEGQVPGVKILEPRTFGDPRGFFRETWHAQRYVEAGIPGPFVQDNLSSSAAGVLRGLHLQVAPSLQGKLVSVPKGAILDMAVDVRVGSPTFGQSVVVELTGENGKQLWVPPGFAHGFVSLEDDTLVAYKCTATYDPAAEVGIRWDDPALALHVPGGPFQLSDKDEAAPSVDAVMNRLPRYTP